MTPLLILGAGSHGRVISEIAADCGYDTIAFLDDNNPDAIGALGELTKFVRDYPNAFVALGNPALRETLIGQLKAAGYHVPALVHPTAYFSRSAVIGAGSVVEPSAVVNTGVIIGEGCIIGIGGLIDHDTVLEDYAHVDSGAIVPPWGKLARGQKLEPGRVLGMR